MQKAKASKILRSVIVSVSAMLLLTAATGIVSFIVPDNVSLVSGTNINDSIGAISSVVKLDDVYVPVSGSDTGTYCIGNTVSTAKIFGIIPIKTTNVKIYKDIKLYPGGTPFGIKLKSDKVTVNGITDIQCGDKVLCPAKDAGLAVDDVIRKINGKKISSVSDVSNLIENSNGKTVTFEIERNKDVIYLKVTPVLSDDGKFRTGISVKDSSAGIGTLTFIDPVNKKFAGLGHGICDQGTGDPVPFIHGEIMEVNINGISKGKAGDPGEIKGYFTSKKLGTLSKNINSGVYGELDKLPEGITGEALPIAMKNEISEGAATIYCTLADGALKEYSIEISKINTDNTSLKNFLITVTDPELLKTAGGIIQGMSGSPIIQDGKIVGAVTHVLINDPTKGYGIFIENMLDSM